MKRNMNFQDFFKTSIFIFSCFGFILVFESVPPLNGGICLKTSICLMQDVAFLQDRGLQEDKCKTSKPLGWEYHEVGYIAILEVSCGCFLKWWYPQIIHFYRVFHYKPSIWGTTIFGNPHVWSQGVFLKVFFRNKERPHHLGPQVWHDS